MKKDHVKLICLLLMVGGLIAILLTDNQAVRIAHGFSSGPPPGRTGAPGELTCATSGCHQGSLNEGPGQLAIIAPTTYEPGETYEITVRHTTDDSSRRRWGFQLTALTISNDAAGDLRNPGNLTTILSDGGAGSTRQYIQHTSNGTFQGQTGQAGWSFNWTAPSTNVGPVIFYAAGNQADNDGTNSRDQIYTTIDVVLSGPPKVLDAEVAGKKLIVTGENIDIGATLFVNGKKQKKTSNDEGNLTTRLVAKKGGKSIERGQTVTIVVKNPDGAESEAFPFTRPLN